MTEIPGYVYMKSGQQQSGSITQGDVISCSDEVLQLMKDLYPKPFAGYNESKSDNFLMVVSQTCDLYRSPNRQPKLEHFSLCLVRDFRRYLGRFVERKLFSKIGDFFLANDVDHDALLQHVQGIINNSNLKQNLFLPKHDIFESHMIALFSIKYAVRIDHYDAFLKNRVCSLTHEFQAKVGYLLADFYGRVATTDLLESGLTIGELHSLTAGLVKGANVRKVQFSEAIPKISAESLQDPTNEKELDAKIKEHELEILTKKRAEDLAPFKRAFQKSIRESTFEILGKLPEVSSLNIGDAELRKISNALEKGLLKISSFHESES